MKAQFLSPKEQKKFDQFIKPLIEEYKKEKNNKRSLK